MFIWVVFPMSAQVDYSSLSVSSLTMQDGLATNYIKLIYQDSKGFIWIGTREGLNRFDGISFTEYTNHPDDTLTISGNLITDILEDNHGQLWIGSTRGLSRKEIGYSGFKRYPLVGDAVLRENHIAKIFEDEDQRLWIGTGTGNLYLYHRESDTFELFAIEGKSQLRDIADGPGDMLILGYGDWVLPENGGGLMLFNKKTKQFVDPGLGKYSLDLSVTNIVQHQGSEYWVSTYNSGLYVYDYETNELNKFQAKSATGGITIPDILFGITKDSQDILWLSTDGWDLMWYDATTDHLSSLSTLNPLAGTADVAFTAVYEDRSGVFWTGTVNNGLLIFDKYRSRFRHLGKVNGISNLSGASVLALEECNDGGIWIGFDHGGVNYVNIDTQTSQQYLFDPEENNTISDDVINGLFEAKNGDLYIGTYLNGFDILDPKQRKFTHFGGETSLYDATYIKCFYEDREGNIWIGSRNQGLIKYNPRDGSSVNFKHDPNDPSSITLDHVSAIIEENENSLWVGTFYGLNRIDINSGTFKSWVHRENDPTSLSGVEVYALCKDQQGGLWIGTDNGLNYYDRLNDNFKHFTTSNGLSSNTIKGILADDDNNLWISTNRGISKLSISDMSIRNFGKDDGLIGLEFEENAALKASDGTLYFGSTEGICFFDPKEITQNSRVPKVVITNLLISNKPVSVMDNSVLEKPISESENITLNPNHSVFSFEYVALNYTSPQKNQYAYMLEGFDKDWNYVDNNRLATYTNISAGNYTFRVKASNNDGLWNEEGTSINVTIEPVWWKKWWAFTGYFLIFIIAGIGARKSAISRIKLLNDLKLERLAKEKEHEVNQIKIRFFTNLSHEFRTPLTLILGPLDKMIDKGSIDKELRTQLKLMRRNARRLYRLINQLMDFRKAENGQMELQASEVDVVAFVKKTVENFNLLAREKGIRLKFKTSLTYQNLWIDKEMIDKVIYNLLSNAFNFTEKGGSITVSVEFATSVQDQELLHPSNKGEYIAVTVSDTGKGISEENKKLIFERFYQAEHIGFGTGIGLSLVKSLVELHKGQITVKSEPGVGSNFIVLLPLGKSHLNGQESPLTAEVIENGQKFLTQPPGLDPLLDITPENIDQKELSLLIVEDNSELRYFLKESLRDTYNIFEATNGREALELVSHHSLDLILSDVMMPEMDGFELCKRLKSNIDTSHIPVVLLTAKSEEENAVEGLQTGADAYITKPFSLNLLYARIKNLIETRMKLMNQFHNQVEMDTETITSNEIDDNFLRQVIEITEKNMSAFDFNIEEIIKEVGMSRSNFFRKIKSLTGQSPVDFVNTIRFKAAGKLLLTTDLNVGEVALQIGYASTKNFRNGFKKHFNQTPTEFVKVNNVKNL